MSYTVQSLTEMASSIQAKDIITFTLNTDFLNNNFTIVKQCLLKIQELEGSLGQEKETSKLFNNRLKQIESNLVSNQLETKTNGEKIRELQNNVGDEFMKRMYGIEQKTKNMFTFDDTVSKLEAINKFVTVKAFNESEKQMKEEIEEIKKIKNQFERYVPKVTFQHHIETQNSQLQEKERKIVALAKDIERLEKQISNTNQLVNEANNEVKSNTKMIKEINFPEFLEKNKKFKEDLDQKMNDLILKMKKKVGSNELIALQQTMIEKLDKFLTENQRNKAEKAQTRDALIFLEKRINDIEDFFAEKNSEDEKDALFSVKKWQCASCTKDLGKFEGKLGQYRPWSIFPCKQLDPEKTGGFGYMSYLDKVSTKKIGSDNEQNTERLNKTAYDKERQNSPKRGSSTARTSNLISNYGSEEKGSASLKDAYFRQLKSEKGDRSHNKFFRVKKDSSKPASEFVGIKQV